MKTDWTSITIVILENSKYDCQIWSTYGKIMFKRWWNSGLIYMWGHAGPINRNDSEMAYKQTRLCIALSLGLSSEDCWCSKRRSNRLDSSRVQIFPKNAQIFLTNISRIFLTNITWQLESANISQKCLPSSASWWILNLFQLFDLTLVPQERFGGITFTSENGRQTRQLANSNQC